MLFLLLLLATEAHFKTSLQISSDFIPWDDLSKAKLIQNVYKAKLQTDSCFELDRKTQYCGVADEMSVLNAIDFAYFTAGDVVLVSEIISVDDVKQVLDGISGSQRAYVYNEAKKQGYDLELLLKTKIFDEEYLELTFEIVCHVEFSGKLFEFLGLDDEIAIFIKARQNSPFCMKQEKLPTGTECQTGYSVEYYATEFQIPFGLNVVCENPLDTCIRTDGSQNSGRGICARETEGVGCGNACPADEYCAMTSGFEVARADYSPQTAAEIAWLDFSVTNVLRPVTVNCLFRGNFEGLSLLHSPPYRRYDTPFCSCKKRLAEGSYCQYSFDKKGQQSLNSVVSSLASHYNEIGPERDLRQGIDVGCAENLVCKIQQKDLDLDLNPQLVFLRNLFLRYGTCVARNQN